VGKLFISYRRDDTQDITGRLFERLAARFGAHNIFMDVDSIPIGADFRQILRDAIADSSVALVMIGRQWLTVADERGQRRLDNPNDFVRIEVEAALARGIPVVPILTQGAAMPHERDLPPSMAALAFRHGVDVRSDQHFGPDAEQLIARLAPLLTPQPVASPQPSYPLPDVPSRLASLGFQGINRMGTPAIIPPLVSVAAGPFLMGSDKTRDPQAYDSEMPQDWVEVDAFQIGKYPVTVAEYAMAVNAKAVHEPPTLKAYEGGGEKFPELTWQRQLQRLDHPVVCVSWQDANAYITWLRTVTRQEGWRLPTEAQWEKAARWDPRANVSRIYPWGDSFDHQRCNTHMSGQRGTTPVGWYGPDDPDPRSGRQSGASSWGAEDMTGNVSEWTSSLPKPYKYSESDGREDQSSTETRALRGGSWDDVSTYARAAYRSNPTSDGCYRNVGFRLALSASAAGS
jgi:formylglycine-generating enzyme required for sulfatase activity